MLVVSKNEACRKLVGMITQSAPQISSRFRHRERLSCGGADGL